MSEGFGGENNVDVGRVYAHPEALIDREGYVDGPGPRTRLVQTLFLVAFGGVMGALIGSTWGFGFAGFFGGAMLAGAIRTGWLMFALPEEARAGRHPQAGTEEDVQAALGKIRAQEK